MPPIFNIRLLQVSNFQTILVACIEKLEQTIAAAPSKKQAVLLKYL